MDYKSILEKALIETIKELDDINNYDEKNTKRIRRLIKKLKHDNVRIYEDLKKIISLIQLNILLEAFMET